MPVLVPEVVYVPSAEIAPSPFNPNVQTPAAFEALAQSISDDGFVENLLVAPKSILDRRWQEKYPQATYCIVWGEHRWRAMLLLDEDAEIPCVVLPEDTPLAKVKALVVRGNMLHGDLDKRDFTALFDEVEAEYGTEATKALMGLYSDRQFQQLYKEVKSALPEEMQKELDEEKDNIKTMDGLATTLNSIWSKHGETIPYGFISFTFGGQLCYLIEMDGRLKGQMRVITSDCEEQKRNINELLGIIIGSGMKAVSSDDATNGD